MVSAATELFWSGLLDSNQRPRAPQTCALPTALNPDPLHFAGAKLHTSVDISKFLGNFFIKNFKNTLIFIIILTKSFVFQSFFVLLQCIL